MQDFSHQQYDSKLPYVHIYMNRTTASYPKSHENPGLLQRQGSFFRDYISLSRFFLMISIPSINHRENGGTLGMAPLIINPTNTPYIVGKYWVPIPFERAPAGGAKQLGAPTSFINFPYASMYHGDSYVLLPSLKLTACPLKIGLLPQKEIHNRIPTIHFQGLLLLVLGRV